MESREERLARFCKIWTTSRTDAGKSQEFLAEGLGVSRKTIQNWEKGISAPDLFQGSEWFRVLGLNPIPYYYTYLYPETFKDNLLGEDDDAVEQALNIIIRNSSPSEKRQLLFIMGGRHGSPWHSLLQMFTAHCHTIFRSRVNAAQMILNNYLIEEKTDTLVCPKSIRPDTKHLSESILKANEAILSDSSGYTNVDRK